MTANGMMQDSGVEWIGEIPQGWKRHRIKDVAELSPTYSANKPDSEMLCTVIPMECVSEKGIVDTSNLDKYGNVSKGLTFFEKGDVIFAKITPCMENGKGAYIENLPTKYAFGSTEFHVLRTGYKLNGKFLYYYTFNDGFRDYAAVNMTGAAGQKRVSTNFLKYTPIYLPDISEQQAIARYLDQRCGKLDAIIAIQQQQIKTLDALRQSIIYHAVTKGLDDSVPLVDSGVEWLGKIPKGWQVDSLKRLLDEPLKYGANEAAELDDRALPRYIRITDFNHDGLLKDSSFKSLPLAKAAGYYLQNGDVLFARSGATVGKTFIFYGDNKKACFAGYIIKASTNRHLLLPEFLYFYTKSPAYDMWKNSIFTQATIQNIGADKYAYLPVIVPPLTEQQRIVGHLDHETQRLNDLKANLSRQISTLEVYKKALIYECVTGKKRIKTGELKAG